MMRCFLACVRRVHGLAARAFAGAGILLLPAWVAGIAVVFGLLDGYVNGSTIAQARLGALGLVGIVAVLLKRRCRRSANARD